jgi:hypothetical protein
VKQFTHLLELVPLIKIPPTWNQEEGHMAPKVAIVGIVLVMALTIATAMPLDEVIPIFHPQFLLVY